MLTRLLRRLVLPVLLVSASLVGTAGVAAAAPTGPIAAAPIHIFKCSSQGTYTGIWVNSRLAWCVANAGTLYYTISNVTSINGGNNAGYVHYSKNGSTGGAVFAKHQTIYLSQVTMSYITIY
jgi:hypothetical protein